jgi:hypothetical protein
LQEDGCDEKCLDGLMLLLLGEKVAQTELDEKEYSLLRRRCSRG